MDHERVQRAIKEKKKWVVERKLYWSRKEADGIRIVQEDQEEVRQNDITKPNI